MFKKFFVLFIALICFPVFANTKNELRNLIDELNYDLTVEWDQRDQSYYDKRVNQFKGELKSIKELKVQLSEMISTINGRLSPEAMLELESLNSEQELLNFIQSNQSKMYSSGPNWSGKATLQVAAAILIVALIVGIAVYGGNLFGRPWTCDQYASTKTCETTTECGVYGQYDQCTYYLEPVTVCDYQCLSGHYE